MFLKKSINIIKYNPLIISEYFIINIIFTLINIDISLYLKYYFFNEH